MQFYRVDVLPEVLAKGVCYITRDGVNNSSLLHFVPKEGGSVHSVGHLSGGEGEGSEGSGSIDSFASVDDFPPEGEAGVLYLDESTGSISVWNSDTSSYSMSGGGSGGGMESFISASEFPPVGETGVLYLDESTGIISVWNDTDSSYGASGGEASGSTESFPTEADFPSVGEVGVLYIDESTGIVSTWNNTDQVYGESGGSGNGGMESFPTEADFPSVGEVGTLYLNEATGIISVWNDTDQAYGASGGSTGTINTYPTEGDFPTTGIVGALYLDESTGSISVWNADTSSYDVSGGNGSSESYPTEGDFPTTGEVGTLYLDESTGDIFVWNADDSVYEASGEEPAVKVESYPTKADFPVAGVAGNVYVDEGTGEIYGWDGTDYNLAGVAEVNVVHVSDIAARDHLSLGVDAVVHVKDAIADPDVGSHRSATYFFIKASGGFDLMSIDGSFGTTTPPKPFAVSDHGAQLITHATGVTTAYESNGKNWVHVESDDKIPVLMKSQFSVEVEVQFISNTDINTFTNLVVAGHLDDTSGFAAGSSTATANGHVETDATVYFGLTGNSKYSFCIELVLPSGVTEYGVNIKNIRCYNGKGSLEQAGNWIVSTDSNDRHLATNDTISISATSSGGGGTTTSPLMNSIVHSSGRFMHGNVNDGSFPHDMDSVASAAQFDADPVFTPINGSTISHAQGMIWDTDTLGGSSTTLTVESEELMHVMGLSAPNAPTYNMALISGDNGSNGLNGYPDFVSDKYGSKTFPQNNGVVAVGREYSSAMWVRVMGKEVCVQATHINGVPRGGLEWITLEVADGWVHIACAVTDSIGYANPFGVWMSDVTSPVCIVALPYLSSGSHIVTRAEHAGILMSSN